MARVRDALAPLRFRSFTLLLVGQALSGLGNEAYDVALVWLLAGLTGSTLLIGEVLMVSYIPTVLLLAIGGVWADRASRRGIVLGSDLLRAGATAVFAALVILGRVTIGEIFVLAALYGLVSAFFYPALAALRPMLLPAERYGAGNALGQAATQAATLAGPAIGGALIARWSVGAALAFDAATFLVAVAATLGIGRLRQAHAAATTAVGASQRVPREGTWRGIRAGMRFLWGEPGMLTLMAFFALSNGLNDVLVVLVPVLIHSRLRLPATAYGLCGTSFGVAALLGALVIGGRVRQLRRYAAIICGSMAVFGLAIAATGLAPSALALYGAFFIAGLSFIVPEVICETLWQLLIPPELRGRVFGVLSTLTMGLNPPGLLLAGVLGQAFGIRAGLGIGGGAIALLALLTLALPVVRRLDDRAAAIARLAAPAAGPASRAG